MTRLRTLSTLVVGLIAGVVLVVACGDDTTPADAADAATCDCPAAEPPLAGRITAVRSDGTVLANGAGGAVARCPAGAIALGGACEALVQDVNVVLLSSRFDRTTPSTPGYRCDWGSIGSTQDRVVTAEVTCLMPAQ